MMDIYIYIYIYIYEYSYVCVSLCACVCEYMCVDVDKFMCRWDDIVHLLNELIRKVLNKQEVGVSGLTIFFFVGDICTRAVNYLCT